MKFWTFIFSSLVICRVSGDGSKDAISKSNTVRIELDVGEEVLATRRCILSCESEEDLRKMNDISLERPPLHGKLLWLRSCFRRKEASPISRYSAQSPTTIEFAAARPGWALKQIELTENEALTTRPSCFVCALGSSIQLDGGFIKFKGGVLTIAAPGVIVKRRGPASIDDRRLVAFSSGPFSIHTNGGTRWRRFSDITEKIFLSTALHEPSLVVIRGDQSSSSAGAAPLIPGRRSGLVAKFSRLIIKYLLTTITLLLTIALARCRFELVRVPRSFITTIRDFRQAVVTLTRLASLISNDVHTVLGEKSLAQVSESSFSSSPVLSDEVN